MNKRLTPAFGLSALSKQSKKEFVEMFKHGSLVVEFYKPNKIDKQTPHTRDEVYVIISGSGYFINDGIKCPFEAGEVIFVPAGIEHKFENFTDDFTSWVFFYGLEGGEKQKG